MALLLNDPSLLGRFRSGDPRALSQVYYAYAAGIESYIRRRLRRAGPRYTIGIDGTVADLVQDAFACAFRPSARLAYDGAREYTRFLTAIARNTLVDHLRRTYREEPADPITLARLLDSNASVGMDESSWKDPRLWALVQGYLAGLPEREHAVFELRFARNQSQHEAASTLGLTRQQIRTLEGRLRTGLARALGHPGVKPSAPRSHLLTLISTTRIPP